MRGFGVCSSVKKKLGARLAELAHGDRKLECRECSCRALWTGKKSHWRLR
jgi:hypothetical protein